MNMETFSAYNKTIKYMHPVSQVKSMRNAATVGDRILECAIRDLLERTGLNDDTPMFLFLKSNKFLNLWDTGFIRNKCFPVIGHKTKATIVEAWIWFIYENFGEKHTMRYIKGQIKKHAVKFI